jgi:2-amino-4-hydroxy-6-hydroxymethyldihydropteridine diphosphokinase
MAVVFIMLGSNVPSKKKLLEKAESFLNDSLGKINEKSVLYETEPWGFKAEENFYNRVIRIQTALSPSACMKECLRIELLLGRIRSRNRYETRSIDIDILFYDDRIILEQGLQVPHPRMHLRRFVLEPLDEIAPLFVHPVLKKTVHELLQECQDSCYVKRLEP